MYFKRVVGGEQNNQMRFEAILDQLANFYFIKCPSWSLVIKFVIFSNKLFLARSPFQMYTSTLLG